MRKTHQQQSHLPEPWPRHEHAKELEEVSAVLESNPTAAARVAQDLAGELDPDKGREGLSGDFTLRAALVRQFNGFSYEELAFHLEDSATYRRFCGLGLGAGAPSPSTLERNIKSIRPETWQAIHRLTVDEARRRGVEDGKKARIDCTVVASPIHDPDDASLLYDVVRVLVRELRRARALCPVSFHDRTRRAKRRRYEAAYAKKTTQRHRAYRDLIDVTVETLNFVPEAIAALRRYQGQEWLEAQGLADKLDHFARLGWRVVDQTHRRVCEGEQVPAAEKIVSIFEEHTDIIVKERRDVHYGHKVCLSTGASSLVLDCLVLDGNPADATLVAPMLDRHSHLYDRPPRQAAMDGGFASKGNVRLAKERGVEDVCFSKRRGIPIADMAKSTWVYKQLKRFRAGVEAIISLLKRCLGLDRCRWRGRRSFDSYVWAAAVSCNLLVLARHALE